MEADFRIAMDQRRKEALTALTAEQLATRTATEEMRERAHAEGRRMVEAAQAGSGPDRGRRPRRPWVRLREQRQRMVGQLAASRADLDALVAALGPLPDEQDSEQATPPSGSPVVQPSPAFTPTPHPR